MISALFGYVCVRHTRIFFGILTLALVAGAVEPGVQVLLGDRRHRRHPRAPRQIKLLGGLVEFTGSGAYQRSSIAYYYYVLVLFAVAVAVMWVIVHSPFGKALQAIRDNETRAGFVGIPVRRYRWLAFVISGCFTGLAGALWVPLNGLTTPDILYWPFSGEIVFMTVLRRLPHLLRPDRRRVRVQLSQGLRGREHGLLAARAGRACSSRW